MGIVLLIVLTQLTPHRWLEQPAKGRCSKRLTRDILDHSLNIGTQFMLNHQKPVGNFTYEYDWVDKSYASGDSPVRQAGAMWGLALIYQDGQDEKVGKAVEDAFEFFTSNSKTTPDGRRYIVYPGQNNGRTGTVALCALAYIDYLRAADSKIHPDKLKTYQEHLTEYLQFLVQARNAEGLWHASYSSADGEPSGPSSPYFDGESLLALVKAAKYMAREELRPTILNAADAGYRHNIHEALQKDPDSTITKGYYQWSSMAFYELAASGWPDTEKYGDYVLDLANWMIDVHKTLRRRRNTGYAYEGIIHAYQLALQRNEPDLVEKLACVIDTGLEKLTSWQVGSRLQNRFIRRRRPDNPLAIGGVQNHPRKSPLRIDVAQHQMHAVILARRYVYK